jgi:hypothetical protein
LIYIFIYKIKNKNKIMKRIIRLTESDLTRIVRRVIREQASALPDGTYYGDGSGYVYTLYKDQECTIPTGFKVKALRGMRGSMTGSLTTITNGVPNSEDWGEGGEIMPVAQ